MNQYPDVLQWSNPSEVLKDLGVVTLTGEACKLSMRQLCDVRPDTAEHLGRFFGGWIPAEHNRGANGFCVSPEGEIFEGRVHMMEWEGDRSYVKEGWRRVNGHTVMIPWSMFNEVAIFLAVSMWNYHIAYITEGRHARNTYMVHSNAYDRFQDALAFYRDNEDGRPDYNNKEDLDLNYLAYNVMNAWHRHNINYRMFRVMGGPGSRTGNTHFWSGRTVG